MVARFCDKKDFHLDAFICCFFFVFFFSDISLRFLYYQSIARICHSLRSYTSYVMSHGTYGACGATDNASDYGSEDSRFESWQARIFFPQETNCIFRTHKPLATIMPTYIMFWKEIDINFKYILMPTMLLIVCPRFILLFLLTSLLSFFSFLVTVIFHKIKTLINKVSMLP